MRELLWSCKDPSLILAANAYCSVREPLLTADWNNVKRTLEVTQFGTYHTCQLAAQKMVKNTAGGKIVIIGLLNLPEKTWANPRRLYPLGVMLAWKYSLRDGESRTESHGEHYVLRARRFQDKRQRY